MELRERERIELEGFGDAEGSAHRLCIHRSGQDFRLTWLAQRALVFFIADAIGQRGSDKQGSAQIHEGRAPRPNNNARALALRGIGP